MRAVTRFKSAVLCGLWTCPQSFHHTSPYRITSHHNTLLNTSQSHHFPQHTTSQRDAQHTTHHTTPQHTTHLIRLHRSAESSSAWYVHMHIKIGWLKVIYRTSLLRNLHCTSSETDASRECVCCSPDCSTVHAYPSIHSSFPPTFLLLT